MNKVYQVQIQGNVPYNSGAMTMGGASNPVNVGSNQSYTSCREVEIVTSSIRDALALASAILRPTECITNIYERNVDVIIDPSCIPRG